jgi:hypothetical protein
LPAQPDRSDGRRTFVPKNAISLKWTAQLFSERTSE